MIDLPQSTRVALYLTERPVSPEWLTRAVAMIKHCEWRVWQVTAVSRCPRSLAALIADGTVQTVMALAWRRELDDAIREAGGRVEYLHRPASAVGPASADLVAAVRALADSGRLTEAEAAELLRTAGSGQPGPARRGRSERTYRLTG